ncbi:MAG: L,D-transpeptidase family protein [bacterium]|nr:L,D-transpeptidase family protein [bacterium]
MKNAIDIYSSGKAVFRGKEFQCAIGKNGITNNKKEGDGKTPAGCFEMRKVLYRKDKIEKPQTDLLVEEIQENDAWCDDVNDKNYNQQIKLPYGASHEKLWRDDEIYDIVVVLGYNDNPVISGKGSAIFMHIARKNYSPTAGCVAFNKKDLLEILKNCDKNTLVCIKN